MNGTINLLKEFITSAESSRKYSKNTADGFKAALKWFEPELNEEEKSSINKFHENIEQIYLQVFNKNKTKLSIASLQVYKKRINTLLNNYKKYGQDPKGMASWTPRVLIRRKKTNELKEENINAQNTEEQNSVISVSPSSSYKLEIPLTSDRKAVLVFPVDLIKEEAEKIKAFIDAGIPTVKKSKEVKDNQSASEAS